MLYFVYKGRFSAWKERYYMRLQKVQDALNKKNIKFEYTEEDGCGSLDFMFRGLKFHVW